MVEWWATFLYFQVEMCIHMYGNGALAEEGISSHQPLSSSKPPTPTQHTRKLLETEAWGLAGMMHHNLA